MGTDTSFRVTEEQERQFREEGYFLLRRAIPDEYIQMLREECQRYIDEMHGEMDRKGTDTIALSHRGKRYFIPMRYKDSERMTGFLFSGLMAEICRATLGDTAFLFLEQFVVKMAEGEGTEFAWHQDSGYVPFSHRPYLTCWCTLDDVTEDNGTIYILPYSRAPTRKRVEHVVKEGSSEKVGYHGDDPGIPVVLPAGSIAVFSSTTFHRSGPNITGKMRRVLLVQYSPEPIYNPDAKPRHWVEPFLKESKQVG